MNPSGRAATASLDRRDAGNMGLWAAIVSEDFARWAKGKHLWEQNFVFCMERGVQFVSVVEDIIDLGST